MGYAKEQVLSWLNRPLESYYPIIYIDAIFISTRRVSEVSKEAYYVVLGVRPDRRREVLGIINYPTESSDGWQSVLDNLRERGVKRVDLVVSDALPSIENAIARTFPMASIQFCVTHLERNVFLGIKPNDKEKIKLELKEVFQLDNPFDSIEKGWKRWLNFIENNKEKYPFLTKKKTERYRYYFTYLKYDYRIRSMLYTTNWVERLNRDFRRVTKMRGALPNPKSTLVLLGSVAQNKKAYKRKIPKLNYDESFDWIE